MRVMFDSPDNSESGAIRGGHDGCGRGEDDVSTLHTISRWLYFLGNRRQRKRGALNKKENHSVSFINSSKINLLPFSSFFLFVSQLSLSLSLSYFEDPVQLLHSPRPHVKAGQEKKEKKKRGESEKKRKKKKEGRNLTGET